MLKPLKKTPPVIAWFPYDRQKLPETRRKIEHQELLVSPVPAQSWDSQWLQIFLQYVPAPPFSVWATKELFRIGVPDDGKFQTIVTISYQQAQGTFVMYMKQFHPALFGVHKVGQRQSDPHSQQTQRLTHYFTPAKDMRLPMGYVIRTEFCKWYLTFLDPSVRIHMQCEMMKSFSKSTAFRYFRIVELRGTFEEVLTSAKGVVSVNYTRATEQQFRKELGRSLHRFCWMPPETKDVFRILQDLVWKAPWADSACQACDYLELDASFYCFRPYVFCIPHAVIHNTALPVGLSIGPGETKGLYERFFQLLTPQTNAAISPQDGEKKFCLSDEGSALQSFCGTRFKHVLCHHHVLRGFGSSPIAVVINLLLTAATQEEFDERVQLANETIDELLKHVKIADGVFDKYKKIAGCERDERGNWRKIDSGYQKQVLLFWRGVVARCSNHSESIHRVCKVKAQSYGKHFGFIRTLHGIMNYIYELRDSMETRAQRDIKDAFGSLEDEFVEGGTCSCRGPREMQRRWNCAMPWPCVHTPRECRKDMAKRFSNSVCQRITEFKKNLGEITTKPEYRCPTFGLEQSDEPAASSPSPGNAQDSYDIPETDAVSKTLTDQEKVGVILSRWFRPILQQDRDELTSKCTRCAVEHGYDRITAEALITVFQYAKAS